MNLELINSLKNDFDIQDSKIQMYASLQLIRSVELLISEKYADQIFRCPVHLSIGQEAIAVGVSLNLKLEDKVVSTHRSHAHYIAKGGDLFMMLSELIGSPLGCCKGRGGSMHIFDKSVGFMASVPIVGSSLPIATGLSLAEKQLGFNNIVVAFVGDAVLETGAFYESMNLAALKKLPLLVVLEDNVEEVYSQINKVVSDVRSNKPSLVHLNTFRRYEHCGPSLDDNLNYRSIEEIDSYDVRDPLKILGKNMVSSGVISRDLLNNLENEIHNYVDEAYVSVLTQNESYLMHFETNK